MSSLHEIANISGLLESEGCLTKAPSFSVYRFFLFRRCSGIVERGSGLHKTICLVKVNCSDEWQRFAGTTGDGFLKFAPDLRKTPITVLISPENGRKVSDRIDSEVGRINDDEKVNALRALRDDVYRYREMRFHWDLSECVETTAHNNIEEEQVDLRRIDYAEKRPVTRTSYGT